MTFLLTTDPTSPCCILPFLTCPSLPLLCPYPVLPQAQREQSRICGSNGEFCGVVGNFDLLIRISFFCVCLCLRVSACARMRDREGLQEGHSQCILTSILGNDTQQGLHQVCDVQDEALLSVLQQLHHTVSLLYTTSFTEGAVETSDGQRLKK